MTAATKPRPVPPPSGAAGHTIFSLTVGRDTLAAALSRAVVVTTTKTTLPILSAVKVRRTPTGLTLVTTDLDRTLTLDVMIGDTASLLSVDSADVALPAKRLLDIVTQLPPGPVTVDVSALGTACKARVSSGRSRFDLIGLSVDEFPIAEPVNPTVRASVPTAAFAKALARIAAFCSAEQSRPTLNGLLIHARTDGLYLVATDTYHLASERIATDLDAAVPEGQWILPRSAVAAIGKLFASSKTIDFAAEATRCSFSDGETTLDLRLINGPYPAYAQILNLIQTSSATLDRGLLVSAIKRVCALSDVNRVTLAWGATEVAVRAEAEGAGRAEDVIGCAFRSDAPDRGDADFLTSFQPTLLLNALAVHDAPRVTISMKDASRQPVYVKDADDPAGPVTSLVVGLNVHVSARAETADVTGAD